MKMEHYTKGNNKLTTGTVKGLRNRKQYEILIDWNASWWAEKSHFGSKFMIHIDKNQSHLWGNMAGFGMRVIIGAAHVNVIWNSMHYRILCA